MAHVVGAGELDSFAFADVIEARYALDPNSIMISRARGWIVKGTHVLAGSIFWAGLEGLPAVGAKIEPKMPDDRSPPLLTLTTEGLRSGFSTTRGDIGAV